MRDSVKAVIGAGSVWGLYALAATIMDALHFGIGDTVPEIVSITIYGVTLLPSCILAIWYRKIAALWLIALTPIAGAGFLYQIFARAPIEKANGDYNADLWTAIISASIPAILGIILLLSGEDKETAKRYKRPTYPRG